MNKFAAVLSCLVMLGATRTVAAPLAPKKPSQIVNLAYNNLSTACTFGFEPAFQINGDGTTSAFAGIPAGMVFVITSWEFTAIGSPSSVEVFNILMGTVAISVGSCQTDGTGRCAGSVTIANGVPIKSGVTPCLYSQGGASFYTVVHGFLTKDK